MQVGSLTREKGMLLDVQDDVEIAGRTAERPRFSERGESDAGAVFNASGNLSVHAALPKDAAFAFALGAGIGDHTAHSLAGGAGAGHAEKSLLIANLPASAAGAAGDGRFAGSGAGAAAFLTSLVSPHGDLSGFAENRFFEFQRDVLAQVGAALRAAAAARGASEQIAEAEEVTEDVTEILKSGRVKARRSHAAHAGMAEAVVRRSLVGVCKDRVSLAAFLEFFFRVRIIGIAVGMILQSQLAIGALDLLLAGAAGNPEDFVVIAFYVTGQNRSSRSSLTGASDCVPP